jgi:hypothetical protein
MLSSCTVRPGNPAPLVDLHVKRQANEERIMTNELGAAAPVRGRFRPESVSHFKEVAKNMAWLLERPVQKCQEDLARIWGYSGLHELQQAMKRPGVPGPFAPRYGDLWSNDEDSFDDIDRRVFFILFGERTGYWRDDQHVEDRCYLVFEMGLFQEAAEHRACFDKIKHVVPYGPWDEKWPLIYGLPLGLKSWFVSGYTEPVDLAESWRSVLPESRYFPAGYADVRWQRRTTGEVRLASMFQILAPRIGSRKPNGMGKVPFQDFDDEAEGVVGRSWELYYLAEWLKSKLSSDSEESTYQSQTLIEDFVKRPSRATAAQCDFVKGLKDPVGFRDRWAFECLKAALNSYMEPSRALFESTFDDDCIHSLFLHMDSSSVHIGEGYGGQVWKLCCTSSAVVEPAKLSRKPVLQPVIHANGSLIVPMDENFVVMSRSGWYLCHDDSDFANLSAAEAFARLYLPAIGMKELNLLFSDEPYSVIEIDELLVAPGVSVESLKTYFDELLGHFDDLYLPDSYGYWNQTLCLDWRDEQRNQERNEDGQNADYVHRPIVLLITVEGCGLTFVQATHMNGNPVSALTRKAGNKTTPGGEALASMVIEAVKGLEVDVVVFDSVPH